MLKLNDLSVKEIGVSEFVDSKSRIHKVKHSVVFSETEKRDLEEKIAEELYRIFTGKPKVGV